ncbi:universal stress protein [Sphingobium olei]|uniref:Universal stress protein n=1 Tax=Sphingobium olei TaxID=420955 RepID=A0ABW3NZ69_9SPHN
MAIRDILLQASSYAEPTPVGAIERAQAAAALIGARLSLGVCRVHIPPVSNWLANKLLQADQIIAVENRRSAEQAQALVEQFSSVVEESRRGEPFVIDCPGQVTHWALAKKARAYDLTIVPVHGHPATPAMAEGLVFESARPVLLLPAEGSPVKFERVVVGWDGSRVAARALADALPICHQARSVALVTVMQDKDLSRDTPVADACRYLERHGIEAELVEVPAEGRDAGVALQAYREKTEGDLLVMGAFGHSRAREFVLGGATRSVLDHPSCPVLLSH